MFSADGQRLYLSIKGAGNATEMPYGRIEMFDVYGTNITHSQTVYAASGPGGLPFSMTVSRIAQEKWLPS